MVQDKCKCLNRTALVVSVQVPVNIRKGVDVKWLCISQTCLYSLRKLSPLKYMVQDKCKCLNRTALVVSVQVPVNIRKGVDVKWLCISQTCLYSLRKLSPLKYMVQDKCKCLNSTALVVSVQVPVIGRALT